MYYDEEYISQTTNKDFPESGTPSPKKHGFWKKATALVLSALVFGGAAGGAFYGLTAALGSPEGTKPEETQSGTYSLTSLSYSSESQGQSLDVSDIAALGLPSVVSVTNISVQEVQNYYGMFGPWGRGQAQLQETTSCGSGVIVYRDDSCYYLVSNYHVVEGAVTLSVTFCDGETYEAELCGYDEDVDIALLRVAASDLSFATRSQISVVALGDSEELVVGEQVVAIGNALGYGQSVTTGIVSALNRSASTDANATYIQTDAAINPGNSGGALLNMEGELIGINTAKVASTDVEGMGYAIPISQVLDFIESLIV